MSEHCHSWNCAALKAGGFFLFGYLIGRRFNLCSSFCSSSSSTSECSNNNNNNNFNSVKKNKVIASIEDLPTNQSSLKRVQEEESHLLLPKDNVEITPVDVLGPFYVIGAPFRAKLSPIFATGRKLLIRGTLRDSTGHFVPFTVIDFWQANPANDNYDIYFPPSQPKETVYHPRQDQSIIRGESGARSHQFNFRARLLTDHVGRYEIESVIPPPYFDPDDVCECKTSCLCAWRCPHIHAYVQPLPQTNCQELITQLYFDGEKYNDTDKHFTTKTSMKLTECSHTTTTTSASSETTSPGPSTSTVTWFEGNFDIILPKRE